VRSDFDLTPIARLRHVWLKPRRFALEITRCLRRDFEPRYARRFDTAGRG
jgi:hypothetical protein